MHLASLARIAPLAAALACGAGACAHPATTAAPGASAPAASPPPAASSPPVAAAPNGVDPALCYSRDRAPTVPPGQTRAAAGSLFGRDTALAPGALAPDGSQPSPGADLDKEIVRRIIRRHINEVKVCYDKELAAHPYLGGTITVAFLIPPSGIVSQTHVSQSTMGYPAIEDCVGRTMCGWEFPHPLDGRSVVINYPYKLSPADRSPSP
ncbi:MAG TPA: AgmX/PglI C-terminal domain-containing protein [Polyangia bacterium]|jgi:outer membrane biosynthesis protein TonB